MTSKREDVVNIVNRGRLRMSTWFGAAFVCVCVLGAAQVEAHKLPKTEICHFKKRKGVFKKISVSGWAARRHLRRHADLLPGGTSADGSITVDYDCKVVNAPTPVLARAYIDVDRNGMFDPLEDLEIAELLDINDDQIPSLGDMIVLSQYPTSYDPCPAGPCTDIGFFSPLAPVEVLSGSISTGIVTATSAGGAVYNWEHVASPGFSQLQITNVGNSAVFAEITDGTSSTVLDLVFVISQGEPNAGTIASLASLPRDSDDYFINVEFP